ncbi:hypothetical protein FNV43_RR08206 [Rhamnella rubrinervis]|uniref:Agenet-like domain-containing protein n=1 Tax=Rhamnella rubrinervis TaxID=2594499 RepID=A0A8K0HH72_9ROSA|nr:hypothetical protein FNV43_RR08206 [Rhamnella rubrinervis]
MAFRLGEAIEVVKKEDDGVSPMYYEAVITGRRYLVCYETRHADNPQRDLLQEWVDEADIRPTPTNLPFCEHYKDEAVDVFLGGAWRLGNIVGKHDDFNYNVRLVGSLNREIVLSHVSGIRTHLDRLSTGAWVIRSDAGHVDYAQSSGANQPDGSQP